MNNYHPDDRPDPAEQPIRARVPDHVSSGAFSTGVIVMTAQTEFILDFVQNLGRPHQIVARVIMPHHVLPQLVDALQRNIDLYRNRWGDLPGAIPAVTDAPKSNAESGIVQNASEQQANAAGATANAAGGATGGSGGGSPMGGSSEEGASGPGSEPPAPVPGTRQASAQEVYDDLKIRDELLSGAYANAVMIGHGAHEFSFDFITNFYPNSAVSARVFLAAGQVPRLYESLKGTWGQMRARMQPPTSGQPPISGQPAPGQNEGGMQGNEPNEGKSDTRDSNEDKDNQ